MLVFSCEKKEDKISPKPKANHDSSNEETSSDKPDVSTQKDFLVFKDNETYKKIIKESSMEKLKSYSKMAGYRSKLHSLKKTIQKEQNPEDGLNRLDAVLSVNNTIQIGQWIYKIDSNNETVKALYNKPEEYEKLVNDEESDYIYTFSTNQEVLTLTDSIEYHFENQEYAAKTNVSGWFCSDSWAQSATNYEKTGGDLSYEPYAHAEFSARLRLKYIRRGIYFSLRYAATALEKNAVWVKNNDGYAAFELYEYGYQARCGKFNQSYYTVLYEEYKSPHQGPRVHGTIYQGVKALAAYWVKGKFYYHHSSRFNPFETDLIEIYSF